MSGEHPLLEIENLHASVEGNEILRGVDLTIGEGELHALMGPNGSGKSTLAKVVAGHPAYTVTAGFVRYRGEDLLAMEVDERARKGVFLAFQYPSDIPGVTIAQFLRQAKVARTGEEVSVLDFYDDLMEAMGLLEVEEKFAERFVNDGFSGGEKKRNEILQMAMLKPDLALLDETDSGLDIDALKIVARGVNRLQGELGRMGVLIITHYQRILNYITPDFVHVMVGGKIIRSGDKELAKQLESEGYKELRGERAAVAGSAA
ncbi:MAG TPA: Fe-S cluster assembly ATPase SufC, partial [Gemmatimonadota bacterium]|nr:Fe-S cluster assembly ATPase SufC [Gemmatimonadota bacterium]